MKNEIYSHVPTDVTALEKIRSSIPSYISGKRLCHTYSVEKEALRLAELLFPTLGVDKKYFSDISAAALLHDLTKYLSYEEQISLCKKYAIPFGENDGSDTAVLHSRTAAYVAKEDFCINDTVFGAIYCHTTGKEDMNIFEKIIFIADYIEETRTHESCIKAREYFYSNAELGADLLKTLDMTIIMSLDSTLSYLESEKKPIDSQTIRARNFLLAEYALQRSVQE
ncbi:MAG: bis(5'-nucleosyl)-tetraphosphatase (symmetrical) YqeK [Clostridia bacterium]|nr:bis(5'-nucleosyl)-tetraphosphatase (symmetrical) YqeK [Clostridia bacterium]